MRRKRRTPKRVSKVVPKVVNPNLVKIRIECDARLRALATKIVTKALTAYFEHVSTSGDYKNEEEPTARVYLDFLMREEGDEKEDNE